MDQHIEGVAWTKQRCVDTPRGFLLLWLEQRQVRGELYGTPVAAIR